MARRRRCECVGEAERVEAFAADIELLQQLARTGATTAAILSRLHDSMGMASTLSTLDTHRKVSHAKAARVLDHRPRPLEDTVRDMMAWYREQGMLA